VQNSDIIRLCARDTEPDRYAAALLAPVAARADLMVLAAYLGDVARIPLTVSDPTLVEIRLQWWRDALSAGAQGGLSGNPISDEMVRTMSRHGLDLRDVLAPLDARSFEVSEHGLDFEPYLDDAEAAPARMAAKILGLPPPSADQTRGYALIRLALRLPLLLAKGHWPVPSAVSGNRDPRMLNEAEARDVVQATTAELVRSALQSPKIDRQCLATLPASLVTAYAKALQKPSRDALRQPADIAPLTRLCRLWWASFRSPRSATS
jgi:15-cis-phytoene synthase